MSYEAVGTHYDLSHLNGEQKRSAPQRVSDGVRHRIGAHVRFIKVLAEVSLPVQIAVR
jgi:hypothetical protein